MVTGTIRFNRNRWSFYFGGSPKNRYESENTVFFFCERIVLVEKDVPMLLGNFMSQGH